MPHLQHPLQVHGQLGLETPQDRRAARSFEWGGFVPISRDLLRGSARRRSSSLRSRGCGEVHHVFGVWVCLLQVWTNAGPRLGPRSHGRGSMNSGPTVHRGSGTSAGSPPGSLNESQSRSMVHFCVSRRVRERGWRGQKKEKRKKRVFRTHKAIHIGPYRSDRRGVPTTESFRCPFRRRFRPS